MYKKIISYLFFISIINSLTLSSVFAQQATTTPATAQDDAKKKAMDAYRKMTPDQRMKLMQTETSNPITRLWMVSIKQEVDMRDALNAAGTGPFSAMSVTRLYPILSFGINEKWAALLRFNIPIIGYQDSFMKGNADKEGSTGGLGNSQWTLLFIPKAKSHLMIGLGMSGQIPTATPTDLRNTDWTLGPAMILGYKSQAFILAGLFSYTVPMYSNGGEYKPVTNVQLIWNINLPHGWAIGDSDLDYTYDQSRESGDRWTAPVGIGFSKLFFAGLLPLKVSLEYNIDLAKHNDSKYNNQIILSFIAVVPSSFA